MIVIVFSDPEKVHVGHDGIIRISNVTSNGLAPAYHTLKALFSDCNYQHKLVLQTRVLWMFAYLLCSEFCAVFGAICLCALKFSGFVWTEREKKGDQKEEERFWRRVCECGGLAFHILSMIPTQSHCPQQ